LRRVCSHLGVDYSSAMLEQDGSATGVRWWSQRAHKPGTRGRVRAWRTELSPWQASVVETVAGPLMQELGYVRECEAASFPVLARGVLEACREIAVHKALRIPAMVLRLLRPSRIAVQEMWQDRADRTYAQLRHRSLGSEAEGGGESEPAPRSAHARGVTAEAVTQPKGLPHGTH